MSRRSTGRPAGRASPSGYAGRGIYNTQEIDRYNVVDRDIYSNSPAARRGGRRAKKKRGCFSRALIALLIVVLVGAAAGIGYTLLMFGRLDRSQGADSSALAAYVQQPSDAPAWDVKSDDNITNILLIGIDKNDDGSDGRSDTNLLLSIDNKTQTIRLVSFLRDTYLEIPTLGKNRLNAAYPHGGPELTMQTLENNFRIGIDKYVSVNCDNFQKIIDQMGGLDVPMTKAECDAVNQNMGSHLKAGTNHLDGRLCLYYSRVRDIDSDFGRTGRQRQVVELMIKKLRTLNPLESTKILYDYTPYIKTNLSDGELLSLAGVAVKISNYDMKTMHVPNDGAYENETIDGAKVLVPDLERNSALLRDFLYGENNADSAED